MNNEFLNDNELDRWLRQNAGSGQDTPAADGWDTPSEDVWQGVRAGLDRRRRRRGWFLIFGVLLLAGIGGAGFWFWPQQTPFTPVETQEQALAPELSETTVFSGKKLNDASTDIPSTTQAVHTQTALPGPDLPKQVRQGRPGHAAASADERHPDVKVDLARRHNTDDSTLALATTSPAGSPVPTRISGPDIQSPGTGITENITLQPSSERSAVADPVFAVGGQKSSGTIDLLVHTTAQSMAMLANPLQPLNATARPVQFSPVINTITHAVTPRPFRPGLYAAATTGLMFTTRNLKTSGSKTPNGVESGSWTFQQGALIGVTLTPHWAIETGLQRTAIQLQSKRQINFRYRVDMEHFDNQNFLYRNTANETIETSLGQVDMRMDIGREPSRPITDLALIPLQLKTYEQVHYLRVPVALRWTSAGNGPWSWSLAGGLGVNFESGYDLQMLAARTNRPGVRDISARVQGRARGLAPVVADIQLSAGLTLRLTHHWSVLLAPEFRYGLNPMNKKSSFQSIPVSAGAQAGIRWMF